MQTNIEEPISNQMNSSARVRGELQQAAAQLKFEKLFRGPMPIARDGNVHIDIHGPWTAGEGRTIQAQLGKGGTIAAMRLANSLSAAQGAVNELAVVTAVQDALIDSLDGQWRSVTGTMP
jgi:hypothetical protein